MVETIVGTLFVVLLVVALLAYLGEIDIFGVIVEVLRLIVTACRWLVSYALRALRPSRNRSDKQDLL